MSYENMTTADILDRWDEASADIAPGTSWMHHDNAHRTIRRCIAELTQRGYFDRATVNPAPQEKVLVDGRRVEID
jgi:hypothetical protein